MQTLEYLVMIIIIVMLFVFMGLCLTRLLRRGTKFHHTADDKFTAGNDPAHFAGTDASSWGIGFLHR